MRKTISGTAALVFMSAIAAPALAGGGCGGFAHTETAQTTPPVIAQTAAPVTPVAPTAEQPSG